MSLERWRESGWLTRHKSSRDEISRLMAIVDRDLSQSRVKGLGPEWSFDIAYNAILQAATAALAAAGYRPERQNKHLRAIESLEFTVGLDRAVVDTIDTMRRKRHTAVYEQIGAISTLEAEEAHRLAKDLRKRLDRWLREHHPDLWPLP